MFDDAQIATYVAGAVGCEVPDLRVERLRGAQGLLICRVQGAEAGSFVFKVVPPSRRREIALTARLTALSPEAVACVVASEEDERRGIHWLVMEDVGPIRLADRPAVDGFVAAAESLARLQIDALPETAALRDLGVREVRVHDWEDIALHSLESADRAEFTSFVPIRELERIAWTVTEVARDAAALPLALVHGDLHAGNVALSGGCAKLLDWGSAYIGPAFLGLEELLLPTANHLKSAADIGRVQAAYLRSWTPVLGRPGRLERPLQACRVLVRLQVLSAAVSIDRMDAPPDPFSAATAFRRLSDAWCAWSRIS